MKYLFLVLFFVSCVASDKEDIINHLISQRVTCQYNYALIVKDCYTKTDDILECDKNVICDDIVNKIEEYYYNDDIIYYIAKSDNKSDTDSCFELYSAVTHEVKYLCY